MSISWGRAVALLLPLAWASAGQIAGAETPPSEGTPPTTQTPSERAREHETAAPSPVEKAPVSRAKPRSSKRTPFQPSEKIPADVPSALPTDI